MLSLDSNRSLCCSQFQLAVESGADVAPVFPVLSCSAIGHLVSQRILPLSELPRRMHSKLVELQCRSLCATDTSPSCIQGPFTGFFWGAAAKARTPPYDPDFFTNAGSLR